MPILATGAGAAAGLDAVLDRIFRDQQLGLQTRRQTEDERANRVSEKQRDRQITESTLFRLLTSELNAQDRASRAQDREINNIRQSFQNIPGGTEVPTAERNKAVSTGALPSSRFKSGGVPYPEDFVGPVHPSEPAQRGEELFSLLPTPQELAQSENARLREEIAEQNRMLRERGLDLGETRENRLREWGPPPVTVADPNVPGGAITIPRTGLPAEGAPAAPPAQIRTQAISNDVGLDQLDRLEQMFNEGASDLIGPAEGRARSIGRQVPLIPSNQAFSDFAAATAAFRNAVIKAITGAQMSEPEARRIMDQIPEVSDKPIDWQAKAKQTRLNLQDLQRRIGETRGSSTPPPTSGGSFRVVGSRPAGAR